MSGADLLFGHSRGKAVEYVAHRDAGTSDAGLVVNHRRVGVDQIRGLVSGCVGGPIGRAWDALAFGGALLSVGPSPPFARFS